MLVAFFAGLEFALRGAYPLVRSAALPDGVIQDHLRATGFRHDPDVYWTWAQVPAPAMQINEFGFRRTQAMSVEKPPGVHRAMTFGDSQTLGAGVGAMESYSAYAEQALDGSWEVLNAGISGYRTLNIYRLLQLRMERFSPDAVVVDCMPFDSPRDDGPLVNHPVPSGVEALLWKSHAWRLLRLGVGKVHPDRARWLDQKATDQKAIRANYRGLGNHDLIADWAKERGIRAFFLTYPVKGSEGGVECMTQAGELPPGVDVIDACGALQASDLPGDTLFIDRNHMTPAGNEIVGQAVAAALRDATP